MRVIDFGMFYEKDVDLVNEKYYIEGSSYPEAIFQIVFHSPQEK